MGVITALGTILSEAGVVLFISFCVFFRFWSAFRKGGRRTRTKAGKASDILLLGAWLFMLASTGCAIARGAIQYGNRKSKDPSVIPEIGMSIEELPVGLKTLVTETMTYLTSCWLVKAALVAMMFEIKPFLRTKLRRLLHITSFFTIAAYATLIIMAFCVCLPFSRNWALNESVFCSNVKVSSLTAAAALSIVNDAMIFSIPILLVKSLRGSSVSYLAYSLTIFLFIGCTTLTIVRAVVASHYSSQGNLIVAFSIDSLGRIETTSMLQLSFNFFTACIPQIRVFFGDGENEKRDEILGLLPKDVGMLIITKTTEVQITLTERGDDKRKYKGLGSSATFDEWT